MKITSLKANVFGGRKDLALDFNDGLNVIVGPNESGKSTAVNALAAALFQVTTDKRKTGKEFLKQFAPHPGGKSCDAKVEILSSTGTFRLRRQWGKNAAVNLEYPQGETDDEGKVEEVLSQLFVLGPKTYQRIMFARQQELKQVLENLRDNDIVDSIGSLLRQAVMQLDGVSIDKLAATLDAEAKSLLNRWDLERNCPQGNRGITNPWVAGVGSVLKAWYRQEELKQKINLVQKLEQELSKMQNQLTQLEGEKKEVSLRVEELSQVEGDIIKRAEFEPKEEALAKEVDELKKIYRDWPNKQDELEATKSKIEKVSDKKAQIEAELLAYNKIRRKQELEKLLGQLKERQERLDELKSQLAQIPPVAAEDVEGLDRLEREILRAETAIQAGTLIAQVQSTQPVYVTKDLDPEVQMDSSLEASGYLKFRVGETVIQVQAGQQDFVALKTQHSNAKSALTAILEKYSLDSPDEIRRARRDLESLEIAIINQQKLLDETLGESTSDEIQEELSSLSQLPTPRDKDTLIQERADLDKQLLQLNTQGNILATTLEEWKLKYQEPEKVWDLLAEKLGDAKGIQRELEQLKPLPQEFKTTREFTETLRGLRAKLDELAKSQTQVHQQLVAVERELPQESLAELQDSFSFAQRDFENLRQRAEKILQIQMVFQETVAEMDSNTFEPLAQSFTKYLSRMTLGKYRLGSIDDKLNLDIVNEQNREMPMELLSSGTYDSTALALRFALLEHVFGKDGGVVVLDDCLVDLDPERKEEAMAVIKDYAKDNQVIFTTCNPMTAMELGGNIIEFK